MRHGREHLHTARTGAEYGLTGTVDTVRDRLHAYEAAGVDELVITFVDAMELTTIHPYAQEFLR